MIASFHCNSCDPCYQESKRPFILASGLSQCVIGNGWDTPKRGRQRLDIPRFRSSKFLDDYRNQGEGSQSWSKDPRLEMSQVNCSPLLFAMPLSLILLVEAQCPDRNSARSTPANSTKPYRIYVSPLQVHTYRDS